VSWNFLPLRKGTTNQLWNNVYELADDAAAPGQAPTRIWAAVSDHHDLPYDKELSDLKSVGDGDVLQWDATSGWSAYGATGLPAGPVVSVVYRDSVLYASVWGSGVYRSTVPATSGGPRGAWTQVGVLPATPSETAPDPSRPIHPARIAFDAVLPTRCHRAGRDGSRSATWRSTNRATRATGTAAR
jgi:hypothetical protein